MSTIVVWILVAWTPTIPNASPRAEAYATEAACKAEADRVLLAAAHNVSNGVEGWPIPHVECQKRSVQN